MPAPRDLPDPLRHGPFLAGEVERAGRSPSLLRRHDITREFRGIHSARGNEQTLVGRCAALSLILGPTHAFSHITAARIWGMPLPTTSAIADSIHVVAVGERGRLRRPEVTSWETEPGIEVRDAEGLAVVAPADVWAQLSGIFVARGVPLLDVGWLVAIGDFLVGGRRTPVGRERPLCTRADLVRAAQRRRGKRGAKALSEALHLVREGADSVKESLLRVGLVRHGLPEPEIQVPVHTAQGVLHSDLGYSWARLLLEYQGDHHRTDRRIWLGDLTRVQLFEDAGFCTMLIGDDDVYPDCRGVADRVRRHLLSARTRS